jgi:hypothetical protein
MPDDLYGIGLSPDGFVEVPAPSPNAPPPNSPPEPVPDSIGGSAIGADAQDDQRVRDLLDQHLTSPDIINMLNELIIVNNPLITPGTATGPVTRVPELAMLTTNAATRLVYTMSDDNWWGRAYSVTGITSTNPQLHVVTKTVWFVTNAAPRDAATQATAYTKDGGLTWAVCDPVKAGKTGNAIDFAISNDTGRIYCIWTTTLGRGGEIAYSDDSGDTWTQIAATEVLDGVAGGQHWRACWIEAQNGYVAALVDQTLVLGGHDFGVFYSTDHGGTWTKKRATGASSAVDNPFTDAWRFKLSPTGTLFVGWGQNAAGGVRYHRSTDGFATASTVTWAAAGAASRISQIISNSTGTLLAFMYTVSNATTPRDHRLEVSTDDGVTWVQRTLPVELATWLGRNLDFNQLVALPTNLNMYLYMSTTAVAVNRLQPAASSVGTWGSSYPFTTSGQFPLAVIPD